MPTPVAPPPITTMSQGSCRWSTRAIMSERSITDVSGRFGHSRGSARESFYLRGLSAVAPPLVSERRRSDIYNTEATHRLQSAVQPGGLMTSFGRRILFGSLLTSLISVPSTRVIRAQALPADTPQTTTQGATFIAPAGWSME